MPSIIVGRGRPGRRVLGLTAAVAISAAFLSASGGVALADGTPAPSPSASAPPEDAPAAPEAKLVCPLPGKRLDDKAEAKLRELKEKEFARHGSETGEQVKPGPGTPKQGASERVMPEGDPGMPKPADPRDEAQKKLAKQKEWATHQEKLPKPGGAEDGKPGLPPEAKFACPVKPGEAAPAPAEPPGASAEPSSPATEPPPTSAEPSTEPSTEPPTEPPAEPSIEPSAESPSVEAPAPTEPSSVSPGV